jgi:hypothetical protein
MARGDRIWARVSGDRKAVLEGVVRKGTPGRRRRTGGEAKGTRKDGAEGEGAGETGRRARNKQVAAMVLPMAAAHRKRLRCGWR